MRKINFWRAQETQRSFFQIAIFDQIFMGDIPSCKLLLHLGSQKRVQTLYIQPAKGY